MNLTVCNGARIKYLMYLFFLLFYFWSNNAFSQVPFECNGSAYLISSNNDQPSTLRIVDVSDPNTILATLTPSIPGIFNGIGYNFEDNFIYGMVVEDIVPTANRADIFRIDSQGTVVLLETPVPVSGQAGGLPFWTGSGARSVHTATGVVGSNNTFYTFTDNAIGPDRHLVSVDLETLTYTTQKLSMDLVSNDLAFSSATGLLYGVFNSQIISTNPANGQQQVITLSPGSVAPPRLSGGSWNDAQGMVYIYANGDAPNRLYMLNPQTNELIDLQAVQPYGIFDATACFPTTLDKEIAQPPGGFVPGDVVEVEFSIHNGQALPQTYQFEDVLQSMDLSWIPTSVTPAAPGGGTVSFSGQTLTITNMVVDPIAATDNIPLTFTVSYVIDPAASRLACYSNQASISFYGITVLSDDPNTAEPVDPTDYCLSLCDVPAPSSGGNQYQCAEASNIPTLVATATVEAGQTLTWYDALVGGNVVTNPSLNTVGEITYYAQASQDDCNSSRTPVFLKIESPQINNPGNEVHCESYTFPAITGVGLSGNEAYYSDTNGGGTKYLPGDVTTDVGDHTFYIYDEIQARDNCEGALNVVPNSDYVLNDIYGTGTHFRYTGAVDPEFWNGNANQQILSNAPGAPSGDQIYTGIIGEVSLGDTSTCFGDQVNISAQVDVTNQGPVQGAGYSGSIDIINTNTNQRLYTTNLEYDYPVGSNSTVVVSGVVSASEVSAGNIAILIVVETIHGGDKDWLLSNFNAGYQFFPANIPSCSGEEEFSVNILGLPDAGAIGGDQTLCFGETPSMIASTTDGSAGGTISYRWESSTTDADSGFSTIAGETGPTLIPGALTQTTFYRRVTVNNENGITCESLATGVITMTVNQQTGAGAIGADQTLCSGEIPLTINSITDGSGGGTISYRWESSTTDVSSGFSPIAGETGSTLSPGTLTQTTFYRRISITDENGTICESLPTDVITINVIPIPIGYDDSINGLDCSGNFSYNLQDNVNDTASGGNAISANFTWVAQPNSSIVGASSGTGPVINQSLQNLSNAEQTLIYTITAISVSDPGCSSTFDVAVIVPVCSSMNLTKVSDVSSVDLAGNVVNYTFTLTNTSNANQTNIVLSDPLMGGTISGPESGDVNANLVLEAGEIWLYNASYTVLQEDIDNNGNPTQDSGILQNIAMVTSAEIPSGVTATSDVLIERNPSSTIEKIQSSGPNPVTTAGEVLGYTITVTNTGNVSLSDVIIDDTLPDGSTGTVVLTSGDVDGDVEVDPGEQWIYSGTYTVTQSDIDAGEDLVNSAVLTTDLTNTPKKDTVGIPTVQLSDIITQKKTLNNDLVSYTPGGSVEYTIEVHNNGPSAAQDVHIVDIAPVGTSIRSWTAEVVSGAVSLPSTSGAGNLDQTLAILPNQGTVRYNIIVDIPIAFEEDLVNAVTVTTATDDPNPDCIDCTTIPLVPAKEADIVTLKTVHDDFSQGYAPGMPVIYEIEVTNKGPNSADEVNVVDIAPSGTTITSWTAEVTQGNMLIPATSGTGDLDEIIPNFPNQATVVYTIILDVPEDFVSDLTNVAEVFSPTEDPDPICPDCEVTIPRQQPEIALIKTATLDDTNANGFADAGESIVYSFSVTNTGNVTVTDITIVDEMFGLQLSGEPFDLEPGQTNDTAYSAIYVLKGSDLDNGNVTNQAVALGKDPFHNEVDDFSDPRDLNGDTPTTIDIERDCKIEVFNAVTPNADGVNDFFRIAGIECYPENTLEIYNRWGILIFKSNNYDNRSNVFSGYSDGRSTISREESLPTGTYFYVLQYRTEQGNTESKSGYLYLNQ